MANTSTNVTNHVEETTADDLASALTEMHAELDYQFPLAAAQFQYRSHYYGLSSAGLLEDVYFDAFHHFLQKHRGTELRRPPRGQKEWDYQYKSLEASHKIMKSVSELAVIWDATIDLPVWTGHQPIVVSLTSPLKLSGTTTIGTCEVTAVSDPPGWKSINKVSTWKPGHSTVKEGRSVLLIAWPLGVSQATILFRADAVQESELRTLLPLRGGLWEAARAYLGRGGAKASDLEMVVLATRYLAQSSETIELNTELRAGVYVVGTEHLKNLPTKQNNRGTLLPKDTVTSLLKKAAEDGRMTPSPAWFGFYTRNRPPDLFLAQLDEFQRSFSVATD